MTELEPAHPREGCGKAQSSRRSASTIFGIPMERGPSKPASSIQCGEADGARGPGHDAAVRPLVQGHLEEEQKKIERFRARTNLSLSYGRQRDLVEFSVR